MLIAGRWLSSIKQFDAHCAISLDGCTPSTHNRQRGNDRAFELTTLGISALEDAGIRFEIVMAVSKLNYSELEPLAEQIQREWRCCSVLKVNVVMPLGRGGQMADNGLLFTDEHLATVVDDVARLIGKFRFRILLHVDPAFFSVRTMALKYGCGGYCGYGNSLSVLASGAVSVCSLGKICDRYVFGDVRNIRLEHVWTNNPRLAEIHNEPHKKLKGVCRICALSRMCKGGCRAWALESQGDFFAPSPQCQAYYESGHFPNRWISPTEVP